MAATRKSQYQALLNEGVPEDEARQRVYGNDDPAVDDAADLQAEQDARPLRDELPTNDEPPIPLTAGAEEMFNQPAVRQPVVPPAPRVIEAPRPADPEPPLLKRRVTKEDLDSPGYQVLNGGAKENFENMVLRPGDMVAVGVEVIGLHNINDRIELRPGAVVPDEDTGYVPTNYVVDHQRQRMIHDQAERAVGNRKQ